MYGLKPVPFTPQEKFGFFRSLFSRPCFFITTQDWQGWVSRETDNSERRKRGMHPPTRCPQARRAGNQT